MCLQFPVLNFIFEKKSQFTSTIAIQFQTISNISFSTGLKSTIEMRNFVICVNFCATIFLSLSTTSGSEQYNKHVPDVSVDNGEDIVKKIQMENEETDYSNSNDENDSHNVQNLQELRCGSYYVDTNRKNSNPHGLTLRNLFPFGLPNRDYESPYDDDEYYTLPLQGSYPIFNKTFTTAYISTNGIISFQEGSSDYPDSCTENFGFPVIAPFYADIDLDEETGFGHLFYRESSDVCLLLKAKREIARGFPGYKGRPKHLIIVTFDNVTFQGESSCKLTSPVTNTFQTVVATDEVRTFVLFFYYEINWTTGTSSSKGVCPGIGGFPAHVGFDFGNGDPFHSISASCTPDVINMASKTNINRPGEFVFEISKKLKLPQVAPASQRQN